jgi:putative tryptophan/tyrosine transport system substrate-binding protein
LPEFAKEMVSAGVDAIAVIGAVTVRAVRQVTSSIPIVFAVVVEPIGDGLADDLQRPGGNVTGVTTFDPEQAGKQLQLLKAVSPDLECVAILGDRGVTECLSNSNRQAAQNLGLRAQVIRVEGPSPEYEKAFVAMAYGQSIRTAAEPVLYGSSSLPGRQVGVSGSKAASAISSISQSQRLNRRIRVAGLKTWACDYAAS